MTHDSLDRVLDRLPHIHAGPGGAAAVLRDGKLLASHAWGFADAERRIPFTAGTLFRICSITKQFTCGLVLDCFGDPSALDDDVRRALPLLTTPPPALALCHNQSGLRDYWALTSVCGSPVERSFGEAEARRLIAGAASLHFAPGTRYSYANQNFRLLGDIVAARTGQDFGDLLRERMFTPAGMPNAMLCADTASMPDGTLGYEGSPEHGFRPAVNNVVWTGDAGIGASLDDMVAWEAFIDATRESPDGLYRRLSAQAHFVDGRPASYGFGLGRGTLLGRAITAHGGGLRGWRSFRLNAAGERISVVVLFNHMADPRDAAAELFAAALGETPPAPASADIAPGWTGSYLEPETGLLVRLEPAGSRVRLHFAPVAELVDPAAPGEGTRLSRTQRGIVMERPGDGLRGILTPLAGDNRRDIEGVFRCGELESELSVMASGGELYGAFGGDLGNGEMQRLIPVAGDVWRLPCPRGLDYNPPGDWTLAFRREAGRIAGVRVGCWLARGLEYAAD